MTFTFTFTLFIIFLQILARRKKCITQQYELTFKIAQATKVAQSVTGSFNFLEEVKEMN
jgi:hypothetical protein